MPTAALFTLCAALSIFESTLAPLNSPMTVRGFTRGVDGVGVDPASVAGTDGYALQYRHRIFRDDASIGRLGGFLSVPISRFVLFGGYEWFQIPRARFERGTIGFAGVIAQRLWVGLSFQGLSSRHLDLSGQIWSLGLFSELTSWLTLSAGIDGFNRPHLLDADIRPDYVFGASLRPLMGEPWLTLATEVRIGAGARRGYEVRFNRAIVDVAPIEGIHLQAAYAHIEDDMPQNSRLSAQKSDQLWFGLTFALAGLEASAAAVGLREGINDHDLFADTHLALTLRMNPSETVISPGGRMIEVPLVDELKDAAGILSPGSPVSSVAWRLDQMADDPTIDTVLLPIGHLDVGLGTIEEVRAAIKRLRAAGKKVVANLTTADDKAYLVAAACDTVRMDPVSTLMVDGFAIALRFFADTLGKVGVRFQAVEIGTHKTGPDTLTRSAARPADLEMREAILAEADETLMVALTEDRGLTLEQAHKVLGKGMFTASEALDLGLVDSLTSTTDPQEVPPFYPAGEEPAEESRPSRLWSQRPVIAVIPVVGTIAVSASQNPLPGATAESVEVVRALDEATADGDVAAVVLRIDSPGGDVLASDLIWRSVKRLAAFKPVVVSMGDVAASGGYWVAAPAHKIFADANTVTGSIGIFALRADLSGLFDLLEIKTEVVKKGEHADWQFLSQPASDEDKARVRNNMQAYYDTFVSKVAVGRKLDVERVRELAEGKTYTGKQALAVGLVDALGGLTDAVREAKRLADLADTDDVIVQLPQHKMSVGRAIKNLIGFGVAPTPSLTGVWNDFMRRLHLWDDRALALMPYSYELDGGVP